MRKRPTKKKAAKKKVIRKGKGATPKRKVVAKATKRKLVNLDSKRLDTYLKAEKALGDERLKRGKGVIGGTKWLEPTTEGFKVVHSIVRRVADPKDFTRFSYDLLVTFVGPNKKVVNRTLSGRGIPKFSKKEFDRNNKRRKRHGLKAATKKQYFEHVVSTKIRQLVYGLIAESWGKYPTLKKGEKMTSREAKRRLKNIKQRNAKFIFVLNRERY